MNSFQELTLSLHATGFLFVEGDYLAELIGIDLSSFVPIFSKFGHSAPLDEHVLPALRHRKHDKLVFLPWTGDLFKLPIPCYYRDLPTWPQVGRNYCGLNSEAYECNELLKLIAADVALCPFSVIDRCYPIEIGINLIKIVATTDSPGVSPPNKPHRDGERYSAIHLIARDDVQGGRSMIVDDAENRLWEGQLINSLDTLFVDDIKVLHHVEETQVSVGSSIGFRMVLIVDMTPMRGVR